MNCNWDASNFLIFSGNGAPLIYYSHLTAISLFIGLLIFTLLKSKDWPRTPFRYIAIAYIVWLFCDLVLWMNEKPTHIMFFWTVINLVEPLIFVAAYSYFFEFATKKPMPIKNRWYILALLIPTLIMAPMGLSAIGFNLTNCDRDVVEGIAAYYNYALEALFLLLVVTKGMRLMVSKQYEMQKSKLILATLAISFLLFSFLIANLSGTLTGDYVTSQYGHIAVPIFAAFLAYITIKYESFEPKILLIDTLVASLFVLLLSLLFVENNNYQIYANIVAFLIAIPLGYTLSKNIRHEVNTRKKIQLLADDLAAANVQLTDLNRQKSEFVSFASHDLKSPINIIKQFASLIADGTYKEPQKIQETVNKIKVNADRATALVDDFLDIRKIEEGHMDYAFEIKDIVSFVKAATEEYAPLAKAQKNIEVSFATSVAKANVKMDATRLRQVIQNLLSNSLKYSEKGFIKVTITEEQCTILITVKDTGLGMDKALLPILFEQFHRDASVAKKIQGTGLGLYISKQIVLAHGGEIWAESEGKGMGSTFTVRLPKA